MNNWDARWWIGVALRSIDLSLPDGVRHSWINSPTAAGWTWRASGCRWMGCARRTSSGDTSARRLPTGWQVLTPLPARQHALVAATAAAAAVKLGCSDVMCVISLIVARRASCHVFDVVKTIRWRLGVDITTVKRLRGWWYPHGRLSSHSSNNGSVVDVPRFRYRSAWLRQHTRFK